MAQLQTKRTPVTVFIATTAMLSFISFWRAAAIILADLASSAYYAGGDAEKVICKSAPWFILAVMLFSTPFEPVYIEASSTFVLGGAYRAPQLCDLDFQFSHFHCGIGVDLKSDESPSGSEPTMELEIRRFLSENFVHLISYMLTA